MKLLAVDFVFICPPLMTTLALKLKEVLDFRNINSSEGFVLFRAIQLKYIF